MGPMGKQPAPPDYEWTRAPETHRFVSRTLEYASYLQGIEGGIDTAHSSFLHNNNIADRSGYRQMAAAPRLDVERTTYGFRYAGIREVGEDGTYVRMYQFIMPFQQFRSHQIKGVRGREPAELPTVRGHMWVPVDDETTCVYNWLQAADQNVPLTEEFIRDYEAGAGRGPEGETMTRHRVRANDWLIDREVQRTRTFTGIKGVNTQDLAMQESMGAIVPRWREHLGSTDLAIIVMRQIMLGAVRTVQEGGDPPGLDPVSYRQVRAADVILPRATRWQEAAEQELMARG
jgi:hypothetical protein